MFTIKTRHTNVHEYLGKVSGMSDCNQNRDVLTYLIKNPKNEIVRLRSRCSLRTEGRTDGHDEVNSHYLLW